MHAMYMIHTLQLLFLIFFFMSLLNKAEHFKFKQTTQPKKKNQFFI